MTTEDTDVLGRQRSSDIKAKSGQPTCKNCHYNATQHCSTETVLLMFPFLQTNIIPLMWPSGVTELEAAE